MSSRPGRPDSATPVAIGEEWGDETAPVESPGAHRPRRYREVGPVAFGGSSEVVECVDQRLGRRVAIKAARRDVQVDAEVESMLDREAQIVGRLEHQNIIPIHDAGADSRGGRFYVMRLVSQPSLAVVLARLATGDRAALAAYRLGRRLRDFLQICRAVDYAHSRGVVHCDLKPANVLLGDFGEVWVVDWGFAFDQQSPSGFRGGTPGYMAPEQLDPRCGTLDAATDVFALGALLYEMIALRPAFDGATADQVSAALREYAAGRAQLAPPSAAAAGAIAGPLAAELDAICARALQPAPTARYPSAADLARAIEDLLDAPLG
ncbi:MAG TPA: serine/threonine-protein kinase [Kofleriaceae bacterium]|nr:serine/threonine-protein kinase [Kofleriaceae bacterium]